MPGADAPEPWIGSDYHVDRLLLLGESAYSWTDDEGTVSHPSPRHAIELVEAVIDEEAPSYSRFMSMLARALTRTASPTRADLVAAWARVAFTNYVGCTVGEGARVRPGSEMWKDAEQALRPLLARLRPRNIIVLGKEMWKRMPDADLHITDDVQGYRLPNGDVAMCWAVDHPAGGLSWARLADVIAFVRARAAAAEKSQAPEA